MDNKKFLVTITKTGIVIENTETKIKVSAKLQPYTRTKNGIVKQLYQVAFDNKKLGCKNKGVLQITDYITGESKFDINEKTKKAFYTNLDCKRNQESNISIISKLFD